MKNILSIIFAVFISTALSAQTIIDYQSWNPSSPPCNLFGSSTNVPATINGSSSTLAHLSNIGQPTYDGTNKNVNLDCSYTFSGNLYKGTQYQIANTFQAGYSYVITVNAAVINVAGTGSNASVVFNINNGGNGSNSSCTGTQTISSATSGNLIRGQALNGTSFTDYTLNWTTLSTSYANLTVGAVWPSGSSDKSQVVLIRKITITGTQATPSFTLTPNPINITCGQTVSQTFTVNNLNSTSGVTSYVWNLGANNGWIYNGSAAPSSITTTTNTLNLTSTSCVNISSLSATAVIGTTNYNTNTSTVNNIAPTLTVSGADNICTGSETYTINNLPCSASVSWDVSPANNTVIEARSGNQITLQRNGTANGNLTLTATITNVCGGAPIIISKQNIIVGTERPINYTICGYDPNDGCRYPKILFSVYTTYPAGSTYKWYIGNSLIATTTTPSWTYNLNPGACDSYMELSVIVTTTCGDSYPAGEEIFYACESGFRTFSASPNPTTGDVQIEATGTDKTTTIKEIQVTDKLGNLKKKIKLTGDIKKTKINIAELPADTYIIRIYDGKTWAAKKVIKN